MKKIITTIAFIALSTVSAKAIEIGGQTLSITGGLGSNTSVWGASGKQAKNSDGLNSASQGDTTTFTTNTTKDTGVFTDDYSSQFVEINVGQWVSIGYNHTPDSIATPSNVSNEDAAVGPGSSKATVQVDFEDLDTTYIKINTPYGIYAKYGHVKTSVNIKETVNSGNKYANKDTEGEAYGIGYQKFVGETGFGIRVEGLYFELDNVTTDNGVVQSAATAATGGRNVVTASNLQGLSGSLAVTYTLGRN